MNIEITDLYDLLIAQTEDGDIDWIKVSGLYHGTFNETLNAPVKSIIIHSNGEFVFDGNEMFSGQFNQSDWNGLKATIESFTVGVLNSWILGTMGKV